MKMKKMLLTQFNSLIQLSKSKKNRVSANQKQLFFALLVAFAFSSQTDVSAQIFQQQLNSPDTFSLTGAGTVPDNVYFNQANPTSAQFNYAQQTAALSLVSDGNKLTWTKTAYSNSGVIARTTSLSANDPTSLIVKLDLSLDTLTLGAAALTFYMGSNFPTSGTAAPAAANINSQFVVNCYAGVSGVGAGWNALPVGQTQNNYPFGLHTKQTIMWVINNSGSPLSYQAPDNSIQSVDGGNFDVWVGGKKSISNLAVTTAGVPTQNLAIRFAGGFETFSFSNFLITSVPTIPVLNPAINLDSTSFKASWKTVQGATGYKFDAATDTGFTSYVKGYHGYDAGKGTNVTVTGLTAGTTYYYRARSYNTYAAGTNTSGNSIVQSVVAMTPLPITFSSVNATKKNASQLELVWKVASSNDVSNYQVEKSIDGVKFSVIGRVVPNSNSVSGIASFGFVDASVQITTNYYRIKAIAKDGSVTYSQVVSVVSNKVGLSIKGYPNPVRNGNFSLQLAGLVSGSYNINVYDFSGKLISSKPYKANGSDIESVNLNVSSLKTGNYIVELNGNATKLTTSLFINN